MIDPGERASAWRMLGQKVAALRRAAGHTQQSLAPLTLYGRSTIANVETGRQRVTRDFWTRCDQVLGANGALVGEYDRIERAYTATARGTIVRQLCDHAALALDDTARVGYSLLAPTVEHAVALVDGTTQTLVWAPPGQFYPGVEIDAQVHPATDVDRILAQVSPGYGDDPFLRRPRRGLVVGAVAGPDEVRLYGLDTRQTRLRLRGTVPGTPLPMARPYLLDQFTSAIIWAVVNLDEALLNDDAVLEECRIRSADYEQLRTSTASRDLAHDLSPVSQRWLGSAFCAGHILRNAAGVTTAPQFWTTEERGEEASAWLLFGHKLDYLRLLADRFAGTTTRMLRVFCVPEAAVLTSSGPERILLLLAAALMESFGVMVAVVSGGDYRGQPGFVLDPQGQVIMANWVRAEGIWQVDLTDQRPAVRDSADAVDYGESHSVVTGASPAERLWRLSDYLGVPWSWFTRRCAECGDYGFAGLVQPRSRLLRLEALERACRYVGRLPGCGG